MTMTDTNTAAATTGGASLISSKDVTGTEVYDMSGENLGHIDHVMIDKQSGKIAYAVLNFGSFLKMGGEERPLPWSALSYDVDQNGYRVSKTKSDLENAPSHSGDWHSDRDWEDRTHSHYGANPYYI